jgi:exo-1,4-beta-D-glucosaminidase
VTIAPDSVRRILTVPASDQKTYLLDLRLTSATGQPLSINSYWLSSSMDDLDWAKTTWYITPVKSFADFTRLDSMPKIDVREMMTLKTVGNDAIATVTLKNETRLPAVFVHAELLNYWGDDLEEFLPVIWSDNYVTLMPGETRVLTARFPAAQLQAARKAGHVVKLWITGTNVNRNE